MGLAISYVLLDVKPDLFSTFFNAKGKFPLLYINIAWPIKIRPNKKAWTFDVYWSDPQICPKFGGHFRLL